MNKLIIEDVAEIMPHRVHKHEECKIYPYRRIIQVWTGDRGVIGIELRSATRANLVIQEEPS